MTEGRLDYNARAVDLIARRLKDGGRLIYVGGRPGGAG